jgi:hypothetical protein
MGRMINSNGDGNYKNFRGIRIFEVKKIIKKDEDKTLGPNGMLIKLWNAWRRWFILIDKFIQ